MKSWVIVPAICISATAWSQSCLLPLEKSAPDERFEPESDSSVVRDLRTGLLWQRCAVGLELEDSNTSNFDDDLCELADINDDGVADNSDDDPDNDIALTYSWYGALEYADEFSQTVAGTGWRLPNLKELASLVELACAGPAINLHAFPNAVQGNHWSSTPDSVTDSSAWRISFSTGSDSSATKNTDGYIYLVKDPD